MADSDFSNCIWKVHGWARLLCTGKKDLGKKRFRSFQAISIIKLAKAIGKIHIFYSSVESMVASDWSSSSYPYRDRDSDSNQDPIFKLALARVKGYSTVQLSYGLTENFL